MNTEMTNCENEYKKVQLWQYLVYLLEFKKSTNIIQWTNKQNLEFKLVEPEEVARQWGIYKNRPAMTYKNLSRSLRYYYEKNIMQKVTGERYVYKFMCDISDINLNKIISHSNAINIDLFNSIPSTISTTKKSNKNKLKPKIKQQEQQQNNEQLFDNDYFLPKQSNKIRYSPYNTNRNNQNESISISKSNIQSPFINYDIKPINLNSNYKQEQYVNNNNNNQYNNSYSSSQNSYSSPTNSNSSQISSPSFNYYLNNYTTTSTPTLYNQNFDNYYYNQQQQQQSYVQTPSTYYSNNYSSYNYPSFNNYFYYPNQFSNTSSSYSNSSNFKTPEKVNQNTYY